MRLPASSALKLILGVSYINIPSTCALFFKGPDMGGGLLKPSKTKKVEKITPFSRFAQKSQRNLRSVSLFDLSR